MTDDRQSPRREAEAVGVPATRVGDLDREAASRQVSQAVAEGYLTLDELEPRLDAVWGARTREDLDRATADLPPARRPSTGRLGRVARLPSPLARHGARPEVTAYVLVMALLVCVWGATSLAAGDLLHFWPVWPALGWGVGLATHGGRRRCGPASRHAWAADRHPPHRSAA